MIVIVSTLAVIASMKSILERYGKVKQEVNNLPCMSALEMQSLRSETASLKLEISRLQESQRHLMGQELKEMRLEELNDLEAKLDTGLKNVRAQKTDRIEQENIELRRKLSEIMIQNNTKLKGEQKDQGIVETEGKDEVLERGGGEGQIKGSEAGSTSRQIKFSKRRNSLLRKAEEIATLCDSEVGLIIFACTGQLYEYSSTSMKEIIERYNNQKGESHEALETNAPSDIKVLQDEVASLKLQIQDLQDRNRRLMGETSDMGIKDLEILENQLELHLSAVRLQKDQHRSGYIKELHLKRNRVHQENIELKEKMDLIGKGNKEYLNDEELLISGVASKSLKILLSYALQCWIFLDLAYAISAYMCLEAGS
ncbi:hypothetical protein CDL15_Pgr008218 [Punica granatum]|uniref:MADS-box transcription factor 23-like n=1 Tax=Punica granatum TaxID=22663 RepID=A0A218VT52_PUNGR|nr:hypothetical protein CDL15_Pgr008218 [Punica granatum]